MHCIPEQKKITAINVLFSVFAACGLTLFSAAVVLRSTERNGLGILSGFFAMLCVVAALFVLMRYRLIGFTYVIRPRDDQNYTSLASSYASLREVPYFMLDLVVLKKIGLRRETAECILPLSSLKETAAGEKIREIKKQMREKYEMENGGQFIIYDYTLTPGTEDALGLVFLDGEKYVGILLEADERLRALFEGI